MISSHEPEISGGKETKERNENKTTEKRCIVVDIEIESIFEHSN
jgi:hypothetical protein